MMSRIDSSQSKRQCIGAGRVAIPVCTRLARVPVRLTHEGPPGVDSYPRTAPHLYAPHQHVSILAREHLPILTAMAATSRTPSAATSSEPSRPTTTPRQFPQHVAGWLIHVGFSDLCAVRHQASPLARHLLVAVYGRDWGSTRDTPFSLRCPRRQGRPGRGERLCWNWYTSSKGHSNQSSICRHR